MGVNGWASDSFSLLLAFLAGTCSPAVQHMLGGRDKRMVSRQSWCVCELFQAWAISTNAGAFSCSARSGSLPCTRIQGQRRAQLSDSTASQNVMPAEMCRQRMLRMYHRQLGKDRNSLRNVLWCCKNTSECSPSWQPQGNVYPLALCVWRCRLKVVAAQAGGFGEDGCSQAEVIQWNGFEKQSMWGYREGRCVSLITDVVLFRSHRLGNVCLHGCKSRRKKGEWLERGTEGAVSFSQTGWKHMAKCSPPEVWPRSWWSPWAKYECQPHHLSLVGRAFLLNLVVTVGRKCAVLLKSTSVIRELNLGPLAYFIFLHLPQTGHLILPPWVQ